MTLADDGRAEEEEVVGMAYPGVPGGESEDSGLGESRDGVEVEAVESLSRNELGCSDVALDATVDPVGQFEFGQGEEEPGCGPAFGVGPLDQGLP